MTLTEGPSSVSEGRLKFARHCSLGRALPSVRTHQDPYSRRTVSMNALIKKLSSFFFLILGEQSLEFRKGIQ